VIRCTRWVQSSFKFGQKVPPLVRLLKDILERYPEGGQILKELIQNADDAGATEVAFLLDERENHYGVEKLVRESLKEFQGPALYTQNNAVFREEDWSSIQTPYDSMKKEDPMKVGKFGIGFNSIYHLTDFPSVVSGDKIGFFDPHQIHFGEHKSGKGFTMDMARDPKFIDQFSPYNVLDCKVVDCEVTEPYRGTLFRFPLRRRPSELSPNVCTVERIRDLFQSFQVDAHLVLLFLKAVEAITIYEWFAGESEPTQVFKVQLSEATRMKIRAERQRLLNGVSSARSLKGQIKAGEQLSRFYDIEITCAKRGQDSVTQCWLVHNYISSEHEKVVSTAANLHQIPWVGLAVPIYPLTDHANGLGRIFCFLPLPPCEDADSNTGLPVHVHGSFSVADNRRSLKWPAEDRQKDEKAFWNQLLTEHLLTQAYVELILHIIQLQRTGTILNPEVVYSVWPDPHRVGHQWAKYLLPQLLRELSQHAVLYTETSQGRWVSIHEAILIKKQRNDLLSHETVAVDEMLRTGYPVVLPSSSVTICLNEIATKFNVTATVMSPEIVRTCLKKTDSYQQMHSSDKVQLLKYIIQDECYSDLDSLCLLPLSNGKFTTFEVSCSPVYIATPQCPQSLFPGLEGLFLDNNIDISVYDSLKASDCRRLILLVPDIVPSLIPHVLPSQWATSKESTLLQPPKIGGLPTKKWLTELWKWINRNLDVLSLSSFEGLHILPVTSTDGSRKLTKLDVEQSLIFSCLPGINIKIESDLANGLEAIGCTVLLQTPQYLTSCHQLHGTYVCRPYEIVTCLARIHGTPDYRKLTTSQREQIVPLLSAALQVNPPSSIAEKEVLAHLPVIRQYGSDDLISVADCSEVAPCSRELPEHLPIRTRLLAYPSKKVEIVLDNCSVRYHRLTVDNVYSQKVIPQFSQYRDEEKEQLMMYLLDNLYLISNSQSKSDILTRLSGLEFVKNKNLELKAPKSLFNPKEKYAQQLFDDLPVFPIGVFDVDKEHGQLLCRHVGLRQIKELSFEELMKIVEHVAASGSQERGKALLDLFVQCKWAQQLLLSRKSFITGRTAPSCVAWVPIINKPPRDYLSNLQWKGCNSLCSPSSTVAATKSLDVETLQLILGSQLCVVDYATPMPENIIQLLGFATKETVFGAVVRHLRSVHEIWTKEMGKDTENSKQDTVLRKIMVLLSQGFQSSLGVQEAIKRELRNFGSTDWVWLGISQGFASPNQLVLSSMCPVSLEPWLFN
jgi:sacsin